MNIFLEALKYHKAGNYQKASQLYRLLLETQETEDLIYHFALAEYQQGKASNAFAYLLSKSRITNKSSRIRSLQSACAEVLGMSEQALDYAREAVRLATADPLSLNNLGGLQIRLGQIKEAKTAVENALALYPNYLPALLNMGTIALREERYEDAVDIYMRALSVDPTSYVAAINLAATFIELGLPEKSIPGFRKAASVKYAIEGRSAPIATFLDNVFNLLNVPVVYAHQDHIEETRNLLVSTLDTLHGALDSLTEKELLRNQDFFVFCFTKLSNFYWAYQAKNDLDINRNYVKLIRRALPDLARYEVKKLDPKKGLNQTIRPLRVGIISEYLGLHATRWITDLLTSKKDTPLDLTYFPVNSSSDQDYLEYLAKFAKIKHITLNEQTLRICLENLSRLGLDMIIYPDVGMTPSSRLLSAFQLASVQVAHWAHPVTTGSSAVDYFLTAEGMEPDDCKHHYIERLIELPGIGLFLKRLPNPGGRITHQSKNAVNRHFEIGCIQSLQKYLPQHDFVFASIAAQNPNVRFNFIKNRSPIVNKIFLKRLTERFLSYGLDIKNHVIMHDRMTRDNYCAMLCTLDIVLDSLEWSGGNTTLDALEQGCPVLTVPGRHMRSRHTTAILKAIELEELVANSESDLVHKCVVVSNDFELLREIKRKLTKNISKLYESEAVASTFSEFLDGIICSLRK